MLKTVPSQLSVAAVPLTEAPEESDSRLVPMKGALNPDDVDEAVKVGVVGIVVSNHGGRNLDTAPATIDVLPHVAERVAGRVPIRVDGGTARNRCGESNRTRRKRSVDS